MELVSERCIVSLLDWVVEVISVGKQNNKQKLQILEALLIRSIQQYLFGTYNQNLINFETSANVPKCL